MRIYYKYNMTMALGVSLDYLAAMDATLEAVPQPTSPQPKRQRTRKAAPVA